MVGAAEMDPPLTVDAGVGELAEREVNGRRCGPVGELDLDPSPTKLQLEDLGGRPQ